VGKEGRELKIPNSKGKFKGRKKRKKTGWQGGGGGGEKKAKLLTGKGGKLEGKKGGKCDGNLNFFVLEKKGRGGVLSVGSILGLGEKEWGGGSNLCKIKGGEKKVFSSKWKEGKEGYNASSTRGKKFDPSLFLRRLMRKEKKKPKGREKKKAQSYLSSIGKEARCEAHEVIIEGKKRKKENLLFPWEEGGRESTACERKKRK